MEHEQCKVLKRKATPHYVVGSVDPNMPKYLLEFTHLH